MFGGAKLELLAETLKYSEVVHNFPQSLQENAGYYATTVPFYVLYYSSIITHDNIPRCMASAIHSFLKMDILPCMIQTSLRKLYDSWVMLPVYFLIVFLGTVAGVANAMNCSVQ